MSGAPDPQTEQATGECRRCEAWCDKVVDPAGCLALGCPSLVSYAEPADGRTYMACVHRVFRSPIDIEMFEAAERTRFGYGSLKVTGTPLPHCPFRIEQAHAAPDAECSNRRFFDCSDEGRLGLRVQDIRELLT